MGGSGFGGQSGMMGMGNNGMGGMGQQGGTGFLGANNNPNNFLGRNSGQQGGMGMNGMNGMNQFGNNNRGGGNRGNLNTMNSLLGNNGNSFGGNGQQQQPMIRPRQRVAFEYTAPQGEVLNTRLQTQVTKLAIRKPALANVLISLDQKGEVVLRGAVKSEAESKLLQSMVGMEPGVKSIRNELTFPAANNEAP